jgi:putative sterol carrier protein
MIEEIFAKLPESFVAQTISQPKTYYFTLGDIKKTVVLTRESCQVTNGKTIDNADCVCKTSAEFFLRIWQDNYRPGMKDFMMGTIKSNNPPALQDFLRSFGKLP